jgi:hypothetical protein
METIFVNLKSELTGLKQEYDRKPAYATYRTRLHCNCQPEFNRRYGLLVTCAPDELELVVAKVVVCKQCAKGETKQW